MGLKCLSSCKWYGTVNWKLQCLKRHKACARLPLYDMGLYSTVVDDPQPSEPSRHGATE